jgi:hypothetical protein
LALILLTAIPWIAGCKVRMIGDYDDAIDSGVTTTQQQAELRFAKLQSNPNTPFDPAFYDSVKANLAVLHTRASSLPKYTIIAQQLVNLDSQFVSLRRLDSISPRPVPPGLVKAAQSSIAVSVESILKLELALKRGDNP